MAATAREMLDIATVLVAKNSAAAVVAAGRRRRGAPPPRAPSPSPRKVKQTAKRKAKVGAAPGPLVFTVMPGQSLLDAAKMFDCRAADLVSIARADAKRRTKGMLGKLSADEKNMLRVQASWKMAEPTIVRLPEGAIDRDGCNSSPPDAVGEGEGKAAGDNGKAAGEIARGVAADSRAGQEYDGCVDPRIALEEETESRRGRRRRSCHLHGARREQFN